MNCDDIRHGILSGRPPRGPDVERHLEECEACAELLASEDLTSLLRESPTALTMPDLTAASGRLDGAKSLATPVRITLFASAVILVGVLNAVFLLRLDASAYPALRMGIVLAAFAGSSIVAGMLVLRPIHRPRLDDRLLPALVLFGIVLSVAFGLLPAAHDAVGAHPESFEGRGADFWPRAIGCLVYGSIMGFPVLALLWLVGRGGKAPTATVLGGLTAMALAGNVALQLHCPLVSHAHLLVGHAGVPILLTLIGLPIALRRRARR